MPGSRIKDIIVDGKTLEQTFQGLTRGSAEYEEALKTYNEVTFAPLKHLFPIDVNDSGKLIDETFVDVNAASSRTSTPSFNVTLVNGEPAKHS